MAGRYMVIKDGNSTRELDIISPIKFTSKITCRTTDADGKTTGKIKTSEFVSDFNTVENNIANSWNTYNRLVREGASSSQISSAKSTYDNYVKTREKMINDINACSKYTVKQDFDPTITFSYQEPIYGGTWTLDQENISSNNTNVYYRGGNEVTKDYST